MSKVKREQVVLSIEKAREDPSCFLELVQQHVSAWVYTVPQGVCAYPSLLPLYDTLAQITPLMSVGELNWIQQWLGDIDGHTHQRFGVGNRMGGHSNKQHLGVVNRDCSLVYSRCRCGFTVFPCILQASQSRSFAMDTGTLAMWQCGDAVTSSVAVWSHNHSQFLGGHSSKWVHIGVTTPCNVPRWLYYILIVWALCCRLTHHECCVGSPVPTGLVLP